MLDGKAVDAPIVAVSVAATVVLVGSGGVIVIGGDGLKSIFFVPDNPPTAPLTISSTSTKASLR